MNSFLDTSNGNLVANYRMKSAPRVTALTHNPSNAITVTAHPNGTVRMWSPNVQEPLVQLLCHATAIRDVVVDKRGTYMVTSGADRTIRLWDVRTYKCVQNVKLHTVPSKLALSQHNMLAIAAGCSVNVYKDFVNNKLAEPYMKHRLDDRNSMISSMQFCPYEDLLGIGHRTGFSSILIPGAGEANFDGYEANPYMAKSQQREMEVKALLDKVNHELIDLDPNMLVKVGDAKRAPNKHRDLMRSIEQRRKKRIAQTTKPMRKKKGSKANQDFADPNHVMDSKEKAQLAKAQEKKQRKFKKKKDKKAKKSGGGGD